VFDWAIVAARLLQFGSALVLFGSSLFYLYGFKAGAAGWPPRRWSWPHLTLLIAAAGALLGAIWWVIAQTAIIFPDAGTFDSSAIWTVSTGTGFGRAALLRIGLAAVSAAGLVFLSPGRLSWIAQMMLAGALVASFAWTGHGIRDEGTAGLLHLGGDVAHLLTAGVWIGALVPLSFLILRSLRTQTEGHARAACDALESFSGVGPTVVSILVLTGLLNSWLLIGPQHLPELLTTAYGLALIVKLCFFAAMLGLAAANRFRLTPRLGLALHKSGTPAASLHALKRSVLAETGLALLVLFAVSWMGTLEPPISRG